MSYQRESELALETPRKAQFRQPIRKLRLGMMLLFGCLMGMILVSAFVDLQELTALHDRGKSVTARVTRNSREDPENRQSQSLDFEFQVNGISYKGTDYREQREWADKRTGSALPVVYLPSNPNVNRPGTTIDARIFQDAMRMWSDLGGCMLVLIGGIFGGAEVSFQREKALLRKGVAIAAEIVSGVPIANSPTAARRITFRYALSPTETKTRTILLAATLANRLAGRLYVTALYDPAHPNFVRLYPLLQWVEIT